jgi:hypothetical protein
VPNHSAFWKENVSTAASTGRRGLGARLAAGVLLAAGFFGAADCLFCATLNHSQHYRSNKTQ